MAVLKALLEAVVGQEAIVLSLAKCTDWQKCSFAAAASGNPHQ